MKAAYAAGGCQLEHVRTVKVNAKVQFTLIDNVQYHSSLTMNGFVRLLAESIWRRFQDIWGYRQKYLRARRAVYHTRYIIPTTRNHKYLEHRSPANVSIQRPSPSVPNLFRSPVSNPYIHIYALRHLCTSHSQIPQIPPRPTHTGHTSPSSCSPQTSSARR